MDQDFFVELLGCKDEPSTNVRGAAFTINVSLDVETDGEDEPLYCLDFCTQKRV